MYPDISTKRRVDVALRVLPEAWISHVEHARESIAWSLQNLSANALELASLWHLQGFNDKLLVDVSSTAFHKQMPMDAVDFEAHQQECHERVKSALWTHWLPKSSEVFRLIPPVCINGDAGAYYSSIATLQGNQLRQLVQQTLKHYVDFFEEYPGLRWPPLHLEPCSWKKRLICASKWADMAAGVDRIDPQQDTMMWSQPAVFKVQAGLDDSNRPVFTPTFDQILSMSESVLDGAVRATFDMPRIGYQIMVPASGPTHGKSASNSIPTMSLDDDELAMVCYCAAGAH